jgi:hypothetical protein
MNSHRFKLVNSITKEKIGYEYLSIDGWKHDVYDYGERPGTFDQMELGDGFLGTVIRIPCGWININEMQPDFNVPVQVLSGGACWTARLDTIVKDSKGVYFHFLEGITGKHVFTRAVSHWMPIPDYFWGDEETGSVKENCL